MKLDGVEVERFGVVEARPDDVLVFGVKEDVTDTQYDNMCRVLRRAFGPDCKFIILTNGSTLNVVRKAEPDAA